MQTCLHGNLNFVNVHIGVKEGLDYREKIEVTAAPVIVKTF